RIEEQLHDLRWSGTYQRVTGTELPKLDPQAALVTIADPRQLEARGSEPSIPPLARPSLSGSSLTNAPRLSPAPESAKGKRPIVPFAGAAVTAVVAVAVFALGVHLLLPSSAPPAPAVSSAPTAAAAPRETAALTATVAPTQTMAKLTIRVSPG